MKFKFLALAAALLAFSYLAPVTFATDSGKAPQDNPQNSAQPKSSQSPQVKLPDPDKVKHDGGEDDVDAIGNRNVGCNRGVGNWYSVEGQMKMGRSYAMQIEAQSKIVTDPVVTEYINRIGQNIVRHSDAQVPFTIKVIDTDQVNAMALPGGFFYVNSGLILAADNEAELAGVMAHEIAHVAACHIAREMSRGNIAQLATIPLIFVGGGVGYGAYEASSLAVPLAFMKFSRNFEAQADYLGLQYMYKSGYDPEAFVAFFEKIEAMEKKKPGTLAKAFGSHPQTPDRIEKSQQEIATILPARQEYLVSTSEFDDVKARLAALENRRHLVDQKDGNKPSLRRTSSGKDSKDGGSTDDDRPTLKRRNSDLM